MSEWICGRIMGQCPALYPGVVQDTFIPMDVSGMQRSDWMLTGVNLDFDRKRRRDLVLMA